MQRSDNDDHDPFAILVDLQDDLRAVGAKLRQVRAIVTSLETAIDDGEDLERRTRRIARDEQVNEAAVRAIRALGAAIDSVQDLNIAAYSRTMLEAHPTRGV